MLKPVYVAACAFVASEKIEVHFLFASRNVQPHLLKSGRDMWLLSRRQPTVEYLKGGGIPWPAEQILASQ
jgi:hypothetical protein